MRRGGGVVALAVAFVGMVGQPVWAARTKVHVAAESQEYGQKFGGMIGRGVLNAVTSFVDILVNTVNETKSGPPLVGTLVGVSKGAACGVLRLGSGAVDLVTFWVPGFNGFPVSDSYDDCTQGLAKSASAQSVAPDISEAAMWEEPSAEPMIAKVSDDAGTGPIAVQAPAAEPAQPATKSWKK